MKKRVLIGLLVFAVVYFIVYFINDNWTIDHGIPVIQIDLEDVSLEEIHMGERKEKYSNNRFRLYTPRKVLDRSVTIRGRGHYSWTLGKRPYQIIFDKRTSLLNLPASKKYNLLANAPDSSLLKNDFTFCVANALNLSYSIPGEYVDLYINGKYLGNYYITPKVDIDSSYVDLQDDHAILMELDNSYYEEETYFVTSYFHDHITIKDTESDEYGMEYQVFQDKYNEMEKAILDGDYLKLKELVDIDSFAKYYLIGEFAQNPDSIQTSVYFYMDGVDDQIHIGPVWDFDIAYGLKPAYKDITMMPIINNTFIDDHHTSLLFYELLKMNEFKQLVKDTWIGEVQTIYAIEIEKLDPKIKTLMDSGNLNNKMWNKMSFTKEAFSFKSWLQNRYEYFNQFIRNNF